MSKNNSTFKEGFYLSEDGEWVPDGWIMTKLCDHLLRPDAVTVGVMYPGSHTEGGIPLMKVGDVSKGRILSPPEFKISPELDEKHSKTRLDGTELIITLVGEPGLCVLANGDMEGWNVARALATVRLKDPSLRSWIAYSFHSRELKHQIEGVLNTTVQKTLNLKDLKTIYFKLPPLPEQKAISAVLSSLDDKIELLREQNETLETLAQTLFKRWFIDFNFPDENGKPYKDNGGTMIPSELGEIPERWRCSSIYEMAEYINGAAFKPKQFSLEDKGLAVIKIAELKSGITKQTKFCEEMLAEKYYIDNGEVLFSWSGSPETSIDAFIWVGKPAYLNQHIFKVVSKIFGKGANYFLLKSLMPRFINIAKQKQTTGLGHVTVADLKEQQIAIPNCSNNFDTECFEKKFEKILSNTQQIQTLTHLRDTLLPKLMKGEIRI